MKRKGVFKKLLFAIFGLVIITTVFFVMIYKGIIGFNYPSTNEFPLRGIDVSHHQNEIDWNLIKEQNIQFAFIKATEGGDFKDKNFATNWNNAITSQIDVGAYHFFTFCKSGREQATNFIETVSVYSAALPPVIDLEFGGNCALQISDETVLAEIDTLQQLMTEQYQKRPILYVTKELYEHFLIGQFPNNPIWIRNIYHKPSLPDKREWVFWQYANRGHLDGINTYVDLNVFNGNIEEYNKLKTNL